jgi:hypothetical protein
VKFDFWLAEGVEVDADRVEKGITITVDALRDDEGDFVATKVTFPRAKARS